MRKGASGILVLSLLGAFWGPAAWGADEGLWTRLGSLGDAIGLCVFLGFPDAGGEDRIIEYARQTKVLIHFQSAHEKEAAAMRQAAEKAGLLGRRIWVDEGPWSRVQLADNLAGAVVVGKSARGENGVREEEVLRVLHPGGKARLGGEWREKPFPAGMDFWTHVSHGPDANPVSRDVIARHPYRTQFLSGPRHAPAPQVGVSAGGRIFRAFGHFAQHPREEPYLMTLAAFNAFNGAVLWKRKLDPSFKVLRSTLVATPEVLYVADGRSCKLLNPSSGEVTGEIVPPDMGDRTAWKWMALEDGVLHGLLGKRGAADAAVKDGFLGHGWWWPKMHKGFKHAESGTVFVALEAPSGKVLWRREEEQPVPNLGLCLKSGRLFYYRAGSLACLDARSGKSLWRVDAPLKAPRNRWVRGRPYLKCDGRALYTPAGAFSTKDGSLLYKWDGKRGMDVGKMLLWEDGLWFIGSKCDPRTGKRVGRGPNSHCCANVTASVDRMFGRARGTTVVFDPRAGKTSTLFSMRPGCTNGVVVSNGLLYWWPFICDCGSSLPGIFCLGPAGAVPPSEALQRRVGAPVREPERDERDWPTYRGGTARRGASAAEVPDSAGLLWTFKPAFAFAPTAPVCVGKTVYVATREGAVLALRGDTGRVIWKRHTGGPVRFPPTVWKGRAYVGSGDGRIHVFEASSGRLLWRFRVGPGVRRIPVYGKLMSTWPAASGVLVHDSVAYVAAGVQALDRTRVFALDARTGAVKWQFTGAPAEDVNVRGPLLLNKGRLYLAGGHRAPAVFDAATGTRTRHVGRLGSELCLADDEVWVFGPLFHSDPRAADFPLGFADMRVAASGALKLVADRKPVWKKIEDQFGPMPPTRLFCLRGPLSRISLRKASRNAGMLKGYSLLRTSGDDLKILWQKEVTRCHAVALASNGAIAVFSGAAGGDRTAGSGPIHEIAAFGIEDGRALWRCPVKAEPLPSGLAIDRFGRCVVSCEDAVMCFGASPVAER